MYLTGILLFRRFALSIIISSLAAVPQALFGSHFFTDYWQNPRITEGSATLEDFLFCFIAGGGAWISVLEVLHKQIYINLDFRRFMIRSFQILLVGIVSMAIFFIMGIRNFISPYLAMAMCGLLPVLVKREYLVIWISGSLLFSINYLAAFLIVNAIWPEFILSWNFPELSGSLFLGIPLEEYLFGILYGGSMGTCMAYVFDTGIIQGKMISGWFSKPQKQQEASSNHNALLYLFSLTIIKTGLLSSVRVETNLRYASCFFGYLFFHRPVVLFEVVPGSDFEIRGDSVNGVHPSGKKAQGIPEIVRSINLEISGGIEITLGKV